MNLKTAGRRWLAPEVVQTSAMDCGPASLKCLLEGFRMPISYGRLREACQTDIDGTSIDVLEEVAVQLGLQAEQVVLPLDHLLLDEAAALPALLVVTLPGGLTHFVVVWRRHGRWVQVMDPAGGRRWMPCERLLREAYVHSLPVPAAAWREWAGSEEFQRTLRRRIDNLGVGTLTECLLSEANADPDWRPMASLDAAVRLTGAVRRAGGVRGRVETGHLLRSLWSRARNPPAGEQALIPSEYWSVLPLPSADDEEEALELRGPVLIRVRGRNPEGGVPPEELATESRELAAAVQESPVAPGRELLRLLRGDGALQNSVLLLAVLAAAASVILEGLILRGAMTVGGRLGLVEQRLGGIGYVLIFLVCLLFLEAGVAHQFVRLGRRAELRLRQAFHIKIPRLQDRYFQSRPVSDMAERAHALHHIRSLARLGGHIVRILVQLIATTAGLVWLYPDSAALAIAAATFSLLVPLLLLPPLQEQELRLRTHGGALARFFLDSLLGLSTIRAHGAQESVRSEHESLLVEWISTGRQRVRVLAFFEAIQGAISLPVALLLILHHARSGAGAGGLLLLAYWAIRLPTLGAELVFWARKYPALRSVFLRLIEPVKAPENDSPVIFVPQHEVAPASGVGIELTDVSVRAGGYTILKDVTLEINPGTHVAIVGPSGAGKSSLVGLLLGWHRPICGSVRVDGAELTAERLEELRRETAWLDPSVQLWNQTLLDNIVYGAEETAGRHLVDVLSLAELYDVLDRLPDGLQTHLGEGGGLVSGGEGQRVRFARALLRRHARLVILDEPFRGLDREQRRRLLATARRVWKDATILCVTHDVVDTREFDRVLVVADGRVVENGAPPEAVLSCESSLYRALVHAEAHAWQTAWSNPLWRRLRLSGGSLREGRDRARPVSEGGE